MTPFPAAPETYLLAVRLRRGRVVMERHVVVGWLNVQGSLCFPLLALNADRITGRKGILHSGGEVSDMRDGMSFEEVDDWLEHIKSQLEEENPLPSKKPRKSRAKSGVKQLDDLPQELESLL